MRPYTKDEIKVAKKRAYKFVFSDHNIFRRSPKKFKFDRRTRIGNLANYYVCNLQKDLDLDKLKTLKRKGRERKQVREFRNIFTLPIVRDYFEHKHNLKDVRSNRLVFYGRNHWAKTEKDKRILNILSKHFNK